jgi:hypothetical protein
MPNTVSVRCGLVGLAVLLTGCPASKPEAAKTDAAADGGSGSIACYSAVQFNCEENPTPTAESVANLSVKCSSVSGVLSRPAACPQAGFQGKCSTTSDVPVRRWYTGADVAYSKDFCINTAHGTWSTTF